MDKWIEEMEERASKVYAGNPDCGYLFQHINDGAVEYCKTRAYIILDGKFTIQQLQALINHMKKYNKEEE